MIRFQISTGLLFAFAPSILLAGQISIGDFSASAVVQDFEDYIGINGGPVLIGSDTYDSDDHNIISSSKLGATIGRSGVALRNGSSFSNTPLGFIDITLGNPTNRAGVYVGFQFAWTANVEFYNTQDNLLGTITLSGSGGDSIFSAWQSDTGLIQRVLITDSTVDNNRIIIDDFIQEVPEPNCLFLFSTSALIALGLRFRRV